MAIRQSLSVVGSMLFAACSLLAQNPPTPSSIAALEFQTPKNGMITQYENGRKQKAAWHKQQKDPEPLLVWQTLTGDTTGTYIVGRLGQHWADFDKPPITDEADLAEYDKDVAQYVQSLVARYYEFMPKISNLTEGGAPAKFSEIIEFRVRNGKGAEFRAAIGRIFEASQKTNWPVKFGWYQLDFGGKGNTWVLVVPHDSWADFEDKPNVKPYREMLKDAFGPAEEQAITSELDSAVLDTTSQIVQFRPDLSYLPGK